MLRPQPFALTPGQILGQRYRITALLGRGGMGEVWQAYDLKLQVDVALKAMRPERFSGRQGLEVLRREVRAAREVMSPNVCRIFDLVEEEGQEFVSMEYIDGQTLLQVLRERGPLELPEATRLASQFLAGLEGIHQAGLIHRDVKPENIMITRTGRAVLMDFGVAKGIAEDQRGTVAGTPAYMAPEQGRGEALDARADIFAAGVVLAEMLSPAGVREQTSRETVWRAVRQQPARLFDSPWRGVLERAVASERGRRFGSARELARALEEVALRVEGAEDKHPYPGLESFTEAEYFFGREVEVEAVWTKLQRANLLAIIGPSGAGKTSFLQAGLLPAKPAGWQHVLLRPGALPFVALAQALAADLAGDPDAVRELVQIEQPEQALAAVGRWRGRHPEVLLVVDQFEELFALCRPEVQASFADLLGRLAAEADVHLLLLMRDDFLFRCHEHPRLAPISSDLTLLGPPTGNGLRRALVQPALLCGYRFEDEALADQMLAALTDERGALPMLAFAAARLWEQRDRERGLLTREAYERIGGVSGALAQHAEATLERVGSERQPLVREMFRNLVTAQGTRAAADVEELLSVFDDRAAAEGVLRALIDARLLTSFEVLEGREDGRAQHRIEIVHESLLARWPRLVRWQTQDADSAQLRDQLRQQARLWEERQRPDDLLWTGSSYREFALWRERYPGGLTTSEESYAHAMTARTERQRRRRRLAVAAAFALLCGVIAVISWYGRQERRARLAAEASQMLALGRSELDADPSAALAYAIASLELADSPTIRRFALEALSRGPAAVVMPLPPKASSPVSLDFSPDGRWLAVGGSAGVQVFPRDGSPPLELPGEFSASVAMQRPQFGPDSDLVIFTANEEPTIVRVWSLAAGREVRRFPMEGVTLPLVRGDRLFLITDLAGRSPGIGTVAYPADAKERTGRWTRTMVRAWAFDDEDPRPLGPWNPDGIDGFDIDHRGRWVAYPKGRGVYLCPLDGLDSDREWLVGEHGKEAGRVRFDPSGERLASSDLSGEIRLWSLAEKARAPLRVIAGKDPLCGLWFSPSGGMLAAAYAATDKNVRLWDLTGPQDAEPLVLHRRTTSLLPAVAFDPAGNWIAVSYHSSVALWPLARPYPFVLRGAGGFGSRVVAFTSDGASLAGAFYQGGIRIWSLRGGPTRDLWKPTSGLECLALDPLGRYVVAGTRDDGAYLVSLADGRARHLPDTTPGGNFGFLSVSPDGRFAAGTTGDLRPGMRLWDLESGTVRVLPTEATYLVRFMGDGRLLAGEDRRDGRLWRWNLADGTRTALATRGLGFSLDAMTHDARSLFLLSVRDTSSNVGTIEFTHYDLTSQSSHVITTHGDRVAFVALDQAETLLATMALDGVVRVGPITGEEPHLLLGARDNGTVGGLALSPDGHWVACGDNLEPVVNLWRRPEGQPFHLLPHGDFLSRLRALTYLRVVPDRASPAGYRLADATSPGWEQVPTW